MRPVPPELVAALNAQHGHWRAALAAGATRVGWKIGAGDRERMCGERVIGYLTSATQLRPGDTYAAASAELHADAEVAVQIGDDRAIARYAPALEIVDLAGTDDPAAIVAANVWHRAFALGDPADAIEEPAGATVVVGGTPRDRSRVEANLTERVETVARLLDAVGERLSPGDWIITGSIVQVPVRAPDRVTADFGALGRVSVSLA